MGNRRTGWGVCSPALEVPLARLLPLLFVLLAVLAPGLARATTLAVLPFDKGAAGEAYDGLGTALAGMVVSDLAGVEALTLVERERLDAVLAEIELGKSDFVDPKTAARLGRGAGAQVVLLGTYSVVDKTLALDARLVQVESGTVLDGATASGPVSDFVTVEKDLVEALISELDATLDGRARRQLYTNVPTEDWEAFAAFSRARARASEGELEAARAAFEEALSKDPGFTQAAEGLAELQALIATTKERDRETRATRYDTVENRILEQIPDTRERKPSDPWTLDALTGMAVRFTVLHNQQRHCDRYQEMVHYLDLVDWDPATHEEGLTPSTAFGYSYGKRAKELGLERWSHDVWHPDEVVWSSPGAREGSLWRGVREYLFDRIETGRDDDDSGLWVSLFYCYPEAAARKELDRWREALKAHGQDGRPDDDELSNLEMVDLVEGMSDARDGRLDPRTQRMLADLVARYPDADDPLHREALDVAEDVARRVDWEDQRITERLGLQPDTIRERLEGLETGSAPFDADRADWCGPLRDSMWASRAKQVRLSWDEDLEDHDPLWSSHRSAAILVRIAGDMGCFKGVKARFESWEELVQHAKTARTRKHPTHYDEQRCSISMDSLERNLGAPMPPSAHPTMTATMLQVLHSLHQLRCLVEAP